MDQVSKRPYFCDQYAGTTVRHKLVEDGPLMVVKHVDENGTCCFWFNDQKGYEESHFLNEHLKTETVREKKPKPRLAEGDIVSLRSGGPKMTVICEGDSPNRFHCLWYDSTKIQTYEFNCDMLFKHS